MKFKFQPSSVFSFILPIGAIFVLLIVSPWTSSKQSNCDDINSTSGHHSLEKKQKGAHIFSIRYDTDFEPLRRNNIEWVTMVAWAFQEDIDTPTVSHSRSDSLLNQISDYNWYFRIEHAREAGFKVFVKPHVWINNPTDGKWRSDIYPSNDENWDKWKESYRDYILRYAKIAEMGKAEMFCLGAEFTRLTKEKPEFWKELIEDVRRIYSGKITYAANWYKEYENISFWDELDYIGIQAYFPLTKKKNPNLNHLSKGWKKYLPQIESVHKKFDRPVIFTEIGYKSTADSAIEPWLWAENTPENKKVHSAETQANCYKAFFENVWNQDWFAGVHFWQLRTDFNGQEDYFKMDFTPQGKPAESVMAKGFE